jgi:hypothetical protein
LRDATIKELKDWEVHGATWRPVELGDGQVVVELCTCYGEPVDMVASRDPSVIEFVRRHGDAERAT